MSHRFRPAKSPCQYVPPRTNDSQAKLRRMAGCIANQAGLEQIMAQVGHGKPNQREIQERGLAQIAPYLRFVARPDTIERLYAAVANNS